MQDIVITQPLYKKFNPFFYIFADHKKKTVKQKLSQTILVIDDEELIRQTLTLSLGHLPYKIVTVASAEEAIKYLYNDSKNVVLILSDIDLPQMTGLEFLSEIKQHKAFQNIPVILQSGCTITSIYKGLELGAAGFLQKPYTKKALYTIINQLKLL